MKLKILIIFFVLLWTRTFTNISFFYFPNCYFLIDNTVELSWECDILSIKDNFLLNNFFYLNYGINENTQVSLGIPYYWWIGDEKGGIISDIPLWVKFSIWYSDDLFIRIISELYFQLPTGIIKEDSYRRINNNIVSYYPFSTGCFLFAPTLLFNIFLEPFMLSFAIKYVYQNDYFENLYNFNLNYDRIDLQFYIDYFIKFKLDYDSPIYLKPYIILISQWNLSSVKTIENGNYFSLNLELKFLNLWKLIFSYQMPLFSSFPIFDYLFGLQLKRIL